MCCKLLSYVLFAILTQNALSNTLPPAATPSVVPTTPQTAYSYIPHATYGYDAYGTGVPQRYGDGPVDVYNEPYQTTAMRVLQTSLRVFAKVGVFLAAGAVLIVVGTIFTTAICNVTPFCTITFNGFQGIDRETVRALVNPEKISATAALVQDAIGKYQRLQRAVNGGQ